LNSFAYLHERKLVRYRKVLTSADLLSAIRRAGVRQGDIVMTHSSLSAFGYFEGGADMVIDTLLKAVGPTGTIAVPAHSLSWVGALPYDPKTSRALVGAIPARFLQCKEAIRSLHPTHSVAAIGPMAEKLVAGHDHTVEPQSRLGYWGNLVKYGGKVLLLCKQGSNTLMHAGELWGGAQLPSCQVHRLVNGKRVESVMNGLPWHTENFRIVHERMTQRGLLKTVPLGESEIYLMSARDGTDTMMEVMREDPLTPTRAGCKCRWCAYIRANTKLPKKNTEPELAKA
jgi:aminoglycoside 3-N-acetyltransferase